MAERGRGSVSPNPVVGAVIAAPESDSPAPGHFGVPGPEVIGEGWHRRYGSLHAEREALADCLKRGGDPRGATMYVSLEPCAHQGRQPPCVEAIIAAGIARVVIAAEDPSEKTAGRGPALMREAGIKVDFADGDIADRARLANQSFRKQALTGRPLVIFKAAASLDGRIATAGGDSQWISSPASRRLVHRWRAELDSIAVGIETAISDDPLLTARLEADEEPVRQPLRIVFDSKARLRPDSRLLTSLDIAPLLVIFGPDAPAERVELLREAGADLHVTGLTHDRADRGSAQGSARVDLPAAMDELGARGVTSLLLEGGPRLAGAMAAAGLIDEIRLFTAPLLLGDGPALIETAGITMLADAPRAEAIEASASGDDILIRARLHRW